MVNKYDGVKIWVARSARTVHTCFRCGQIIQPKTRYFAESLGKVRPSPGTVLRKRCAKCHENLPTSAG